VLPKGVLRIDVFLPAEIRIANWFIITEDEFPQKIADARSCRKSCLAGSES